MNKKIVIIGSGLGGLAAAGLLAKDGYEVTVLEKNANLGGRAGLWEKDGFKFDLGPSWYLMPDIFEKFFSEMGTTADKELDLVRLNPAYRIFFEAEKDQSGRITRPAEKVDISDWQQVRAYFEALEPGAGAKFDEYMRIAEYQYKIAVNDFLPLQYNKLSDFLSWRMMTEGRKLHVFENMDRYIKRFFKNPRIKKILEYNLVFLGSSPFNTPALYNIMSYVDFGLGVWYPKGGIYELTKALTRLAEQYGAKIHLNTPVEKILVEQGKTVGVRVEGGNVFAADRVISNADYAFTERKLLEAKDRTYSEKYWNSRILAPSAFMMYLGLNKRFPSLQHHNLYFCNDWNQNFEDIFKYKRIGSNPSTYVCAPSVTDPTVAPAGCENVFVLTPIAPGIEVDEVAMENLVMDQLEKQFDMQGIRENILVKKVFSAKDFSTFFNSQNGTALGLAHNLMQTAYFRPKQKSPKVQGLYYVGAGTHPGIGMPMVMLSAQVLAEGFRKESSQG